MPTSRGGGLSPSPNPPLVRVRVTCPARVACSRFGHPWPLARVIRSHSVSDILASKAHGH
eukprot:3995873-Prymnesium_polylepis.1